MDSRECETYGAILDFTSPITARHHCILGQNRHASPTVMGRCNESPFEPCISCMSFDETEQRKCTYFKGLPRDFNITTPNIAYSDNNCPIGFELFEDAQKLLLECPFDSVMFLEIFPNVGKAYNFTYEVPDGIVMRSLFNSCIKYDDLGLPLQGINCGSSVTLTAHHQRGSYCQSKSKIVCEDSDFFLNTTDCMERNGYSCHEISELLKSAKKHDENNNTNSTEEKDCGLDTLGSLSNPIAIIVGVIATILTLIPGVAIMKKGVTEKPFAWGLLSEAATNGIAFTTAISVDWVCLSKGGIAETSQILLPWALVGFRGAEYILSVIAYFSMRKNPVYIHDYEDFKWTGAHEKCTRRLLTAMVIVAFGGFGGLIQFCLVIVGVVEEDESVTVATYYGFMVCAAIGALCGGCGIFCGLFSEGPLLHGAWKWYKIFVADIPGLLSAIAIASNLTIAWSAETINDVLQIVLTFV